MDEDNKLAKLIVGIALFLLGMGSLVTGLFPKPFFGYLSGPAAFVFSIGALVIGAYLVRSSVRDFIPKRRQDILGEPVSPELGLKLLAKRYEEQGNREESLRTLMMLYERERKFEQLEAVRKELQELQAGKAR